YLQGLLVWTPGQRDIIKTLALLLMVADHLNRILHLHHEWMYLMYEAGSPRPSEYDLMKRLPALKTEHPWLGEADSQALKQACAD
ncbi:TraX family protein, partial [Salmonella enterica]|uniref:TraX family protein n=1 Tax=Salmonella enterica TaxID=28901 RepID=UPI003D3439B2